MAVKFGAFVPMGGRGELSGIDDRLANTRPSRRVSTRSGSTTTILTRLVTAARAVHSVQASKTRPGGRPADFAGAEYRLRGAVNEPRARPPLWIGGGGERVTLKLVARHADGCNFGGDPDTIRHKLEVLERHCEAVGRDSSTITRSTSIETPFSSLSQLAEEIRARVGAGMDYVIVFLSDMVEGGRLTRFMEAVAPLVGT